MIEDPAHLQALIEHKRGARAHRGCDALAQVAPAATELLQMAAQRGYNLRSITAALLRLLDQYGAQALQAALLEAIAGDVPHPNAVHLALEPARELTGKPPPLALALPEHVTRRDAPMRMPSLACYDRCYDPPKDTDDGCSPNSASSSASVTFTSSARSALNRVVFRRGTLSP